jgi:hypothetical protein
MVPWQPPAIPDRHVRCRGKAISITYSEGGFVVTVIQDAMRMSRVILPSVVCQVIQYSDTSVNE